MVLLKDSRFWAALILLVQAVLFNLAPNFPQEIWTAINTFLGVTLAILAGNAVLTQRRDAQSDPPKEGTNG
jgi:hypothetical protein